MEQDSADLTTEITTELEVSVRAYVCVLSYGYCVV